MVSVNLPSLIFALVAVVDGKNLRPLAEMLVAAPDDFGALNVSIQEPAPRDCYINPGIYYLSGEFGEDSSGGYFPVDPQRWAIKYPLVAQVTELTQSPNHAYKIQLSPLAPEYVDEYSYGQGYETLASEFGCMAHVFPVGYYPGDHWYTCVPRDQQEDVQNIILRYTEDLVKFSMSTFYMRVKYDGTYPGANGYSNFQFSKSGEVPTDLPSCPDSP